MQNKIHWHIYRLLRGRTISETLPKIPLFGPSLIHQLRLLGSQQRPQSGVLFNFIFNLGNRKYSGGDKSGEYGGCNIFWSKTVKHLLLWGRKQLMY